MCFVNDPGYEYEELMQRFVEMMKKTFSQYSYDELFDSITNRVENYQSNQHILDLFRHHLSWLDERIGQFAQFTWCMPEATLPEHKLVEDFLKSDQQQIIYRNFASVKDARCFTLNCLTVERRNYQHGYSVTMKEGGRGNEAFVEIAKTKNWYNLKVSSLSKFFIAKNKIKALNLKFD
jgi:hypothetical protein